MQGNLPLIPAGATTINRDVSVFRDDAVWTYYVHMLPVYSHDAAEHQHFRLTIAQLLDAGACRPFEIVEAFGLTRNKVMRARRQLRERGIGSFFEPRRARRTGTVLTPGKLVEAQKLLNEGACRAEVAEQLDVKPDTLRKAINDGRLTEPPRPDSVAEVTTSSQRNRADTAAGTGMGTACTRTTERVFAAVGVVKGASTCFEPLVDVPNAGVLCALSALLANGLLLGLEKLGAVRGYYTAEQTLLTLAIMLLCRIRNIEALRKAPPGELGKLLGLDRVPEGRCLRTKMDELAGKTESEQWAAYLSRWWMERAGIEAGFLYIDGHIKIYDGKQKLPRRHVSRQKLCLRGISNYWVNDALGRPFFVVERQIDDGLLQTLRRDIIPRLLVDVPDQPTEKELEDDPHLSRFVIIFDREGYSPAFFREMWDKHRIACITYRKNCTDLWDLSEFSEMRVTMPRGEELTMQLAERGTLLGKGNDSVWVKETRKLTASGHQTAVVTTAYGLAATTIAPRMFTRWCQENFFAYAMRHFPIDLLTEYGSEPFDSDQKIVNPTWRDLERQRNSAKGKLTRRRAKFLEMDSEAGADPHHRRHEKWLLRKAEVYEQIEELIDQLESLAERKKKLKHYITWGELDEKEQKTFMRLPSARRRLMNTIGMICYRAETAMAGELCSLDKTLSLSNARALLQALFLTTGDLIPNTEAKTLEVRVHGASTPAANRRLNALFGVLNEAEIIFPGTDLRLVLAPLQPPPKAPVPVPSSLPRDQEV